MRKAALFSVAALFFATLSGQALAQEPAPAETPKAAPAAAPSDPSAPTRPGGVTFDMGTGLMVLGGNLAGNASFSTVQASFGIKLGLYFSQHVAVSVGLEGGAGSASDGFKNAYSYRFPVRAEYAFKHRFRGPYVDGGLLANSTFGASNESEDAPAAIEASSPVDYSLGFGYRFPMLTAAMDLRFGFDFGSYTHVSARAVGLDVDGQIDPSQQSQHYALSVGLAYRWGTH